MKILKPNQPVRVVINASGINPTHNGFATYGYFSDKSKIVLYQYVDMVTYPSANDFHGESYKIDIDSVGTVICHVGRPMQISRDPTWCQFDLYEIMIQGKIVQVFRQNLEPINLKE
jgi:hypothetical protein